MTHPFHPLFGKSFVLLTYRQTWGEDRVFFDDGEGLRRLPASWTDVTPPPPFVTIAAGRAHFRPDDLLRLVELIDAYRSQQRQERDRAPVSGKLRPRRKTNDAVAAKKRRYPLRS